MDRVEATYPQPLVTNNKKIRKPLFNYFLNPFFIVALPKILHFKHYSFCMTHIFLYIQAFSNVSPASPVGVGVMLTQVKKKLSGNIFSSV